LSPAWRRASAGPWALRIAHEGGGLAPVDRSPLVEEVRHEAERASAEAITIIADLETFAGATAAINGAKEHFGHIDILVNNVGGTIWAKPYVEYGEAQIEAEIRRSLFPTLWCCRAALPGMLDRGAGVIVNVSSVATRGVNRVPYAAAKGGVNAITASLAMEYAAHGIRLCGMAPAGTEAPARRILRNVDEASARERDWCSHPPGWPRIVIIEYSPQKDHEGSSQKWERFRVGDQC
jgi:dihydroxycyclohexadiene carboxylate dehydrogenase